MDRAFLIGVSIKGFQAAFECLCGVSLLFVDNQTIKRVIERITAVELTQHPGDFIARWALHMAQNLSLGTQEFYALYLADHGLVKVLLVIGMLKGRLGAYPLALAALGLFVCYQIFRFTQVYSIGLLVLTAFDVIVIVLVYRQYRQLLRIHRHAPSG